MITKSIDSSWHWLWLIHQFTVDICNGSFTTTADIRFQFSIDKTHPFRGWKHDPKRIQTDTHIDCINYNEQKNIAKKKIGIHRLNCIWILIYVDYNQYRKKESKNGNSLPLRHATVDFRHMNKIQCEREWKEPKHLFEVNKMFRFDNFVCWFLSVQIVE